VFVDMTENQQSFYGSRVKKTSVRNNVLKDVENNRYQIDYDETFFVSREMRFQELSSVPFFDDAQDNEEVPF